MARPKKDQNAESKPLYTAAMRFQDLKEYITNGQEPNVYEIGDDVSHFDQARLDAAVERGTVVYNGPTDEDGDTESSDEKAE